MSKKGLNKENLFTIASFDIGIKNLAFCIMQFDKDAPDGKQFPILEWKNIDLTDNQQLTDKECDGIVKAKSIKCDKQAKVTVDGKNYCCTHNPKKDTVKPKNVPKAASIPLKKLCITLSERLDEYSELWKTKVDHVVIETQFSRNRKMICQSDMLYSYFIIKHITNPDSRVSDIKFISSRNKLQVYKGPKLEPENKRKNAKDQRKMLAVEHCKAMIKGDQPHLDYLNKFPKKKDDLSDCFLQGAWYLKIARQPKVKSNASNVKAESESESEELNEVKIEVKTAVKTEVKKSKPKAKESKAKAKPKIKVKKGKKEEKNE